MVRTIIIPDKSTINVSFSIPENYIGKEMEIIAFSKEEGIEEISKSQKKVSFNALSIDTKSYKFNRDEANER
jgi:hypothetical protein